MAIETTKTHITRGDLENKFRAIQDDVQGQVGDRKDTIKMAAMAGGVVLLLLIYALGRRSGKKKTTIVEIRRV